MFDMRDINFENAAMAHEMTVRGIERAADSTAELMFDMSILSEKTLTGEAWIPYEFHASWWQMFKDRWFPKLLKRWFPVKMKEKDVLFRYTVKAGYPLLQMRPGLSREESSIIIYKTELERQTNDNT
jgi:hypothetical protein